MPFEAGSQPVFPGSRAKADDPRAPAHGFVRTRMWQIESIVEGDAGVVVTMLQKVMIKAAAGGLQNSVLRIASLSVLSSSWNSLAAIPVQPACASRRLCTPTIEWRMLQICTYRDSMVHAFATTPTLIRRKGSTMTLLSLRKWTMRFWILQVLST